MLIIRLARPEECGDVIQFYRDLIKAMRDVEIKPAWEMGVYPTEQLLRNAINERVLYVANMGDIIVGAMILNHDCPDEYGHAKWQTVAQKDEVMIVHLLAVSPLYQRKGIARQMVSYAIEKCKNDSIKAIRLDILSNNSPAEKLYTSIGFIDVGAVKMFYEDTGLADFNLYELII